MNLWFFVLKNNNTCHQFHAWNHFLPKPILIGSFSLLAASTRCRRTSITPSLCLLVSMVSQRACAAGDLVGEAITHVIWFAGRVRSTKGCAFILQRHPTEPAERGNTERRHGRVWVLVSVTEGLPARELRLPCETAHRKRLKLEEEIAGMFQVHLQRLGAILISV